MSGDKDYAQAPNTSADVVVTNTDNTTGFTIGETKNYVVTVKNNGPAKSIGDHLIAPLVRVALQHCPTPEINEFFTKKQITLLRTYNKL